jgi:heat shock protein HtpX
VNGRWTLQRKLLNALQSVVLLVGMAVLAGYLGWILFGPEGIAWAAALAAMAIALTPGASPRWVLRMSGAWEIAPWQAPGLHEIAAVLAGRAGLARAPRLYYVPTRVLNAFATGNRRDPAIAVTDGLLRALDLREVTGVLAHEISHLRSNDIWVMTLADVVGRVTALLSLSGQLLLIALLPAAALKGFALPLAPLAVVILAPLATVALQLALSRTREYDADLGAAALTGDPRGLASALDKLERIQGGWIERVFMAGGRIPKWLRTHPAMEERVRRLLALEPAAAQPDPLSAPYRAEGFLFELPAVVRPPRWHWNGLWY